MKVIHNCKNCPYGIMQYSAVNDDVCKNCQNIVSYILTPHEYSLLNNKTDEFNKKLDEIIEKLEESEKNNG